MIKYLFPIILVTGVAAFGNGTMNPFLDEYVAKIEEEYAWRFVEEFTFDTLWKGTGYVLNVTSLRWMNASEAHGPNGDIWTHQVIVIVPKELKNTNVAFSWPTGGCNEHPDQPPSAILDYDILIADEIAHNSKSIGVAIKQIPNCPLYFESDPH